MQNNNGPLMWPEIDGSPINEFQMPGYMTRAFPTLYPYGQGDLRSERPRDIKPAEYFKHLMWYKNVICLIYALEILCFKFFDEMEGFTRRSSVC
jgi:hypothetical protein